MPPAWGGRRSSTRPPSVAAPPPASPWRQRPPHCPAFPVKKKENKTRINSKRALKIAPCRVPPPPPDRDMKEGGAPASKKGKYLETPPRHYYFIASETPFSSPLPPFSQTGMGVYFQIWRPFFHRPPPLTLANRMEGKGGRRRRRRRKGEKWLLLPVP